MDVSVSVTSFEQQGDHHVFVIKVQKGRDAQQAYILKRRFNHFEVMHASLKSSFNGLPAFPASKWGTVKDPAQLEKRREELHTYLRGLAKDDALVNTSDVRSFLELTVAEQFLEKLQEKDVFDAANLAVKDEALAESRGQLSKVSAEAGALRTKLGLSAAELEAMAAEKAGIALELKQRTAEKEELTSSLANAKAEQEHHRSLAEETSQQLAASRQLATELQTLLAEVTADKERLTICQERRCGGGHLCRRGGLHRADASGGTRLSTDGRYRLSGE